MEKSSGFKYFWCFSPTCGNDPIWLYNMFQMGWNRQLVVGGLKNMVPQALNRCHPKRLLIQVQELLYISFRWCFFFFGGASEGSWALGNSQKTIGKIGDWGQLPFKIYRVNKWLPWYYIQCSSQWSRCKAKNFWVPARWSLWLGNSPSTWPKSCLWLT